MRILIILLMAPLATFAASTEGAHDAHIPWTELLIPQIVNVTFFAALILYFTWGLIINHFKSKRTNFEAAQNAAANAKAKAEAEYAEMKSKITNLTANAEKEKQEAASSAEDLKTRLIAAAKTQAEKLKQDAEVTVKAELQRAIMTLRTETITKSSSVAEQEMRKASENVRMQKTFVNKVQGAQL